MPGFGMGTAERKLASLNPTDVPGPKYDVAHGSESCGKFGHKSMGTFESTKRFKLDDGESSRRPAHSTQKGRRGNNKKAWEDKIIDEGSSKSKVIDVGIYRVLSVHTGHVHFAVSWDLAGAEAKAMRTLADGTHAHQALVKVVCGNDRLPGAGLKAVNFATLKRVRLGAKFDFGQVTHMLAGKLEEQRQKYISRVAAKVRRAWFQRLMSPLWGAWRGAVERQYTLERWAACLQVQACLRGRRGRKIARRRRRRAAAQLIQRVFRGHTWRKVVQLLRLRIRQEEASCLVQRLYRGSLGRKRTAHFRHQRKRLQACCLVQRVARGARGRRRAARHREAAARVRAVTHVQRAYRGAVGRAEAWALRKGPRTVAAAVVIQRTHRGMRGRMRHKRLNVLRHRACLEDSLARMVQRRWRGAHSRSLLHAYYQQKAELQMAVRIQTAYRRYAAQHGYRTLTQLAHMHKMAVRVQTMCRSWAGRRLFEAVKEHQRLVEAADCVARSYRLYVRRGEARVMRWKMREAQCALRLQSRYRAHRQRLLFQAMLESTMMERMVKRLQRLYRQWKNRKKALAQMFARKCEVCALKVQRVARARQARAAAVAKRQMREAGACMQCDARLCALYSCRFELQLCEPCYFVVERLDAYEQGGSALRAYEEENAHRIPGTSVYLLVSPVVDRIYSIQRYRDCTTAAVKVQRAFRHTQMRWIVSFGLCAEEDCDNPVRLFCPSLRAARGGGLPGDEALGAPIPKGGSVAQGVHARFAKRAWQKKKQQLRQAGKRRQPPMGMRTCHTCACNIIVTTTPSQAAHEAAAAEAAKKARKAGKRPPKVELPRESPHVFQRIERHVLETTMAVRLQALARGYLVRDRKAAARRAHERRSATVIQCWCRLVLAVAERTQRQLEKEEYEALCEYSANVLQAGSRGMHGRKLATARREELRQVELARLRALAQAVAKERAALRLQTKWRGHTGETTLFMLKLKKRAAFTEATVLGPTRMAMAVQCMVRSANARHERKRRAHFKWSSAEAIRIEAMRQAGALAIQCTFRQKHSRDVYADKINRRMDADELAALNKAACPIQAMVRRHEAQSTVRRMRFDHDKELRLTDEEERDRISSEHAEQLAALLVQSRFRGHQAVKQQRLLLEQALGMAAPEWLEYWDESSQVRPDRAAHCGAHCGPLHCTRLILTCAVVCRLHTRPFSLHPLSAF
jgi:hypothetical protein